ncbi:MAG: HAD family hydrolase [Planctomycetota bacterium]
MTDLTEIIRRLSRPLEPQPTGAEPRLPTLAGVRAVLFDVYGTLLISASGDISLTSGVSRGDAAEEALAAAGVDLGQPGDRVAAALREVIERRHRQSGHAFPEVDIAQVWRETATLLTGGKVDLPDAAARRLAVEYECRVNPIWPMPGCARVLAAIKGAGLPMGIVSNAQFFTPVAMEALLGGAVGGLGFDPSLCFWSYAARQAKPGRPLYEAAAAALAGRGVQPAEVLYVGNDMLNDVWPAAAVGFQTVLFAGDARSLRLREGDPRVAGLTPSAVVTELPQLLTILSLAGG